MADLTGFTYNPPRLVDLPVSFPFHPDPPVDPVHDVRWSTMTTSSSIVAALLPQARPTSTIQTSGSLPIAVYGIEEFEASNTTDQRTGEYKPCPGSEDAARSSGSVVIRTRVSWLSSGIDSMAAVETAGLPLRREDTDERCAPGRTWYTLRYVF